MNVIIGVDEVGRGPLAGPVVAAAVALPADFKNERIKDSKKVSARNREELSSIIKAVADAWAIVAVGHHRILRHNIRNASLLAMRLAVDRVLRTLKKDASIILVDGNAEIPFPSHLSPSGKMYPEQRAVIKGDSLHVQISAASILAKVWRDHHMEVLDARYPGYGLGGHAGYPTEQHRAAIAQLGPSPVHRVAFGGVREFVELRAQDKVRATSVAAQIGNSG